MGSSGINARVHGELCLGCLPCKMMGEPYEDGEETKSDFLARMFLMGRIELDETNKTLRSTTTCKEETGQTKPNPIFPCDQADGCEEYNSAAKGFISLYQEKIQGRVLDGAKSLIFDATSCTDISFEPDGEPVKNAANFMAEEWHHKYDVKFRVAAKADPKESLSEYFEKTIKQMGDAAVKINHVQTDKVSA